MRNRASELATEYVRTEFELHQAEQREVTQARWTGLDCRLQRPADQERASTTRERAPARRLCANAAT